ncbi:hypothetical protein [Dyella sp.]|jgi:protein TonB|uniref:hypothetical protein n=1 Tax=Dyella sp. TaxID=1869338 RepID=UPI002D7854FA|nr:hypothetical protein [Dyella sp.]HET6433992.1 hypothetical protein [Dyella sp.]
MPLRSTLPVRSSGVSRLAVAAVLGCVLWLAGCGRPGEGAAAAGPASSSVDSDRDGIAILLGLADSALQEKRLLAPEGANAYEFYLSVLQLDPANAEAHQHLDDTFTEAMGQVEQAINTRALDEAARELRLLREVDGNNYTLSLLAGKLDAQRMIVVREDEARAARMREAQVTAARP